MLKIENIKNIFYIYLQLTLLCVATYVVFQFFFLIIKHFDIKQSFMSKYVTWFWKLTMMAHLVFQEIPI